MEFDGAQVLATAAGRATGWVALASHLSVRSTVVAGFEPRFCALRLCARGVGYGGSASAMSGSRATFGIVGHKHVLCCLYVLVFVLFPP